jgi:hypothetical protein
MLVASYTLAMGRTNLVKYSSVKEVAFIRGDQLISPFFFDK